MLLLLGGTASGQSSPTSEEATVWKQRAEPIVKGCSTDYQRARAIYDWVCQNIAYDVAGRIGDANTCWTQKRGICSGYSQLYIKLAQGCGMEAVEISGTAKTLSFSNGKGPHAWVRVKTEKGWTLVDATWGAGEVMTGKNGTKKFERQFRPFWFDVDPQWLIFTHFPKQPDDQLLPSPISEEQYQRLPILWPSMEEWGLTAQKTLDYFLTHPKAKMAKTYDVPARVSGKLKLVVIPLSRTLTAGKSYSLVVEATDDNYRPFLSPQTEWKQEGTRFTATVKPKAKQKAVRLEIGEPDGKGGWTIFTLLEYGVKAQ